MNLKELKSMIAEEYSNYLAEQEDPAVAVSDVDVDADGGDENAEETLRDIYDMLKDYFEGGDADADAGADAGADDADDAGDEEELNEKKTTPPGAGSGPCNQPCPGGVGFTGPKGSGCLPCGTHTHYPTGKKDGKKRPKSTKPMPTNPNEGKLQERFKKLANIIKG